MTRRFYIEFVQNLLFQDEAIYGDKYWEHRNQLDQMIAAFFQGGDVSKPSSEVELPSKQPELEVSPKQGSDQPQKDGHDNLPNENPRRETGGNPPIKQPAAEPVPKPQKRVRRTPRKRSPTDPIKSSLRSKCDNSITKSLGGNALA